MMVHSVVSFLLPQEPDLANLGTLQPDRNWSEFIEGHRAWILRTYREVSSVAERGAAVLRLRDNPDLYAAMVDNGRRRSRELNVKAITEHWQRLLFEHVPRLAADPGFANRQRLSLARRVLLARVNRLAPRR